MRSTSARWWLPVVLTMTAASYAAPAAAAPGRPPTPPAAGHDVPAQPPAAHAGGAKHAAHAGAAAGVTATPPPTPTGLPRGIEPLAPYVPQDSCDYTPKPGVVAFEKLLMTSYPDSGSYGIVNTCLREGSTSEHAEGRAWDWAVSVNNPTQTAEVSAVFSWLFATDAAGNPYAMARRLGIMYIIWNAHIWGAYAPQDGWRPYSCSGVTACHQDHVHISFGWAGAQQRTSFWTGKVAPTDFGPCVPAGQRYAPVWVRRNRTPCPPKPTLPTPVSDLMLMRQDANLAAVLGDTGTPVSVIQRQVGAPVDGSYSTGTAAAVAAYQRAHHLTATGDVTAPSWASFIAAASSPDGDFSGQRRTDVAVYRPSDGRWYVRGRRSVRWGVSTDRPVPGDYTGDGRSDRAVYRPANGTWYFRGLPSVQYGVSTDIPVPADYTGDHRTDIAVYRPSNGSWYLRGHTTVQYGVRTDIPVPADYTGDGRADLAVYRPSTGTWYVRGLPPVQYGLPTDIPVPGDYIGNGRTGLAVYRPASGTWYVRGLPSVQYGLRTDIPVPGDYRGAGYRQLAVYRPSTGSWYVRGLPTVQYGLRTDIPLPLPTAVLRAYH